MRRHYPSLSRYHFLDIPIATAAHAYPSGNIPASNPPQPQSQPQQQQQQQPTPLHLSPPPREESTRVQLQKQRLREQQQQQYQQYHAVVVSQRIPGLRTSAAFFASLRTNLHLHAADPPPSPASTPPSLATSTHSLPPPSPLAGPATMDAAAPAADPLAGVPDLTTAPAAAEADKIAALRLVADGVAQMRQRANHALIRHPLNVALLVALLAVLARSMLARGYDAIAVATTAAGVLFAALAGVRLATQRYLWRAEGVTWDWLGGAEVLVTRFGEDVIGAAVVEWVPVAEPGKARRKRACRGEIRAWTVKMRYRGKGVGAALLEEAVAEARRRGAESLDFAEDHANALRVLPRIYNTAFDRREERARDLLFDLQQSSPARHRRKRGGSSGGSR